MRIARSTTSSASGRHRRRRIAVCACLLLAAIVPASAQAYFPGAATTATASGAAGALPAPSITAAAGAGTVDLSWSPVSAPADATVTYYVARSGGTVGGTCPSSAAAATTSTTCTDTGLSKGSYSYTVTAIWRSWTTTSSSTPVTVASGVLDHFTLSTPSGVTAGASFSETITALDAAGNTVTAFTGSQGITFSGPSDSPSGVGPSYPANVSFASGVGTASITLYDAQTTTLTAAQGSASGTSGSFAVAAGANHQIAASASSPQPRWTRTGTPPPRTRAARRSPSQARRAPPAEPPQATRPA